MEKWLGPIGRNTLNERQKMTLTKSMMQNHSLAIRAEMGYPLYSPANHTLAFAAGRKFDFQVGMDLARHAETGGKDFVYAGWASIHDDAPTDYALIVRQPDVIDILPGVEFWAADDQSPIVILLQQRGIYFELDGRLNLQQRAGRPGRKLALGIKRAMDRIRRRAELLDGTELTGNAWIPNGGDWTPPPPPQTTAVLFR